MSDDVELVPCPKCGSTAWNEIVMFTKVSAVVSPSGKAGIAPVGNTYICMNCGTSIEETEAVKELTEGQSSLIL
jgi:DNA-directed RNA polymerase subunit RPC12/RpoP